MADQEIPVRALVCKLARIAAGIKPLVKEKHSPGLPFEFVTVSDVFEAVRPGLAEASVSLMIAVQDYKFVTVQKSDGDQTFVVVVVKLTLEDGDTGERMEGQMVGQASAGTDKAVTIATAEALKHWLMGVFLIPTRSGKRGESGRGGERESGRVEPPKPSVPSAPGGPCVSQKQLEWLPKLIAGASVTTADVLKMACVSRLEEIPRDRFNSIKDWLLAQKEHKP